MQNILVYFLTVTGDNKLSVIFVDTSNSLLGTKKVPPPLSNGWTKLSYEVKNIQGPFSVRITGSPGVLTRSDIAIDDIALKTGPCPKEPEPIVTSPVPRPTQRPVVITTAQPKPRTEPTNTSEPSAGTTRRKSPEPVWTTWAPKVVTCGPGQFNCRNNEKCIPLALVCDGVLDCPNGIDEMCSDRNQCAADEILCRTGSPEWCLPTSFLCDGHHDCSDGSDESLCGYCPSDYCKNGGSCNVAPEPENGYPKCTCQSDTSGKRCNVLKSASHQVNVARSGVNGWAVAIPVVLILTAVIAAIAFYVVRIRQKEEPSDVPMSVHNPTYDANTGEAKLFQ
ncbi:low-density lipoprotein receptor, putative [Ixodes scapularis]|uniref:Low-density lipoprotein receptor, putative n=1 Tax=Ixodes scapularis TaxID=6945 RepID=B7PY43_IXOSC|nr:low-density lipoprotein receptor, putative [Ixodes scapularis]|eukprot:XP_002402549.1 low-density lipoprotein receptor, putative [Ixodes scapularis]